MMDILWIVNCIDGCVTFLGIALSQVHFLSTFLMMNSQHNTAHCTQAHALHPQPHHRAQRTHTHTPTTHTHRVPWGRKEAAFTHLYSSARKCPSPAVPRKQSCEWEGRTLSWLGFHISFPFISVDNSSHSFSFSVWALLLYWDSHKRLFRTTHNLDSSAILCFHSDRTTALSRI